jgi:hypothetical protein
MMEIFSHFCDVIVQYCQIVILHFHYHKFDIVLIWYFFVPKIAQKLAKDNFLLFWSKMWPSKSLHQFINRERTLGIPKNLYIKPKCEIYIRGKLTKYKIPKLIFNKIFKNILDFIHNKIYVDLENEILRRCTLFHYLNNKSRKI